MKEISYNFGAIRDSIARLSSIEVIKGGENKSSISFSEKIKLSENLKKQYLIYKNIEDCAPFSKARLAERFIMQNLTILKNTKWHELINENKNIRKEFVGNPSINHVQSFKNDDLFENINTLIEHACNPNFKDLKGEAESYDYIVNYLTRESDSKSLEENDNPNLGKTWEYVTKLAMSNFNERYEHLNESDKKLFSILTSSEKNKIEYLSELKENAATSINNALSECDKKDYSSLIFFKEKIESLEESESYDIDSYIIEFSELISTVSNL